MRVGFLITLLDQIERFEPLARRTPGSRFLVAPGRWPSSHRDSRAEIIRHLEASGLAPVISPRADFDLVVGGAECPEPSVRGWLRSRGARVLWREPDAPEPTIAPALTLCSGELSLPRAPGALAQAVGDPLLDSSSQLAARTRALHRLGLAQADARPVLLLHGESGHGALEAMAPHLARLRCDYELLVSVSELRRLERRRAIPSPLRGPGIHLLPAGFSRAEALAACDLVLAEPGSLLFQAAALGRSGLALGSREASRSGHEIPLPIEEPLRDMVWIHDPLELHARVEWAHRSATEYRIEMRERARSVVGIVDGRATARAVGALQLLAAGTDRPRRPAPA